MKKVPIGKLEDGSPLLVDVARLIDEKAIVQGSSGAGKSMTVRTLLEASYGMAPHVVLDKDGEYATLRERHDYVLAGNMGGDIPAAPETAAALARMAMELNFSLIVDLYSVPAKEKHQFVRLFLQSMIDAPKALWRPRLIVVTEAHRWCPENGEGTSEAKGAMIEACEDGRKRGMGMVLDTQRIAKLDKSALAECGNKLIGRTNMDDDRARAARELGFRKPEDVLSLMRLRRGSFYCQGPALSDAVVIGHIDKAKTTHPEVGQLMKMRAPAPSAKVRAMLGQLKALPQVAAKEAKDLGEARAQISDLKRQLSAAVKGAPKAAAPAPDPKVGWISPEEARRRTDAAVAKNEQVNRKSFSAMLGPLQGIQKASTVMLLAIQDGLKEPIQAAAAPSAPREAPRPPAAPPAPKLNASLEVVDADAFKPGRCERLIVTYLMRGVPGGDQGATVNKARVAVAVGYAVDGGTFNNALGALATAGIIRRQGSGNLCVVPESVTAACLTDETFTVEAWLGKLGKAERLILGRLLEDPNRAWDKAEMAAATDYAPDGGTFNNGLGKLSTLGLLTRMPGSQLALSPEAGGTHGA